MQVETRLNPETVLRLASDFNHPKKLSRDYIKSVTKQTHKVNNCLRSGVCRVRSVYLMRAGKRNYKIGISQNPEKRLKCVQSGNPILVELIHSIETYRALNIERLLHLVFSKQRLQGEWFKFSKYDIPYVVQVINSLVVNQEKRVSDKKVTIVRTKDK